MNAQTFAVLASGLVAPEYRTATAIVTRPRGTWKWQDAFGVSVCELHVTKGGRIIWRTVGHLVRKASMPQLTRWGYVASVDSNDSLHNQSAV
jgi:hypothetical protein